jgi:hypothetical protein
LHFTSKNIGAVPAIRPATICGDLIGVRVGDESVLGSYTAPSVVNLAGTTSFYLRSSLRTRNRDPRSLGYSSIIANVPISKPHNGLDRFTQSGFAFGLNDRSNHYIIIEILDDALEPVTFHGGELQVTLEFGVEEADSYAGPTDFRALITQNGTLLGSPDATAGQRMKRLVVDLSEPLGLLENLSPRLNNELVGLSSVLGALSDDFCPRLGAISNNIDVIST